MDKLKPCPFCGTITVSSVFSIDVYNWYEESVVCEECRCRINHPKAIAIWNTRPAEDALKAEVERLKVDLDARNSALKIAFHDIKRAGEEIDKWKKMFYDLINKQASVSTEPKVIVVMDKNGIADVATKESERRE